MCGWQPVFHAPCNRVLSNLAWSSLQSNDYHTGNQASRCRNENGLLLNWTSRPSFLGFQKTLSFVCTHKRLVHELLCTVNYVMTYNKCQSHLRCNGFFWDQCRFLCMDWCCVGNLLFWVEVLAPNKLCAATLCSSSNSSAMSTRSAEQCTPT